ncbi:MAG: pilus assembly protein PilM [Polyangiaceae bacterium]
MQRFLGLDVSRTTVRAALLNVSMRKITVEALEEVSIEDAGSAKDALWAAVGDMKPDGTAVQLSGEKAFFRRIELPAAAMKEIQNVLGYELESTVPFEMEEAVFDHRVMKAKPVSETVPVFACVARIEDVRERVNLVKDTLKLDPERVGVGAMPLSNLSAVIPELEGTPKKGETANDAPVGILSLGERTSDLVILEKGEPVFARSLSRGTYGLPGSAPALSRELRQTLAAWRAQGGELLRGVYLVGGGASAAGAEVFLATELGVSILPLPDARFDGLTPEQKEKLPRFSMAIGLALGLTARSKAFNLRRGPLEVERRYPFLREKVPLLAGLGAAIAVSFLFSVLSENRSLDAEREALEAKLAAVSQEVLGESTTDPQKARELLDHGPGAEDDPLPQVDAFDVMVKLSEAVPKEVAHDVLELDYARNNHVTIQATVPSVSDAQTIADKMKENRCFKDVKVSRTIQFSQDRQKYTLEFDVKCEKEKKKAKEKSDADASPSASATATGEKESGK